MKRAGTNHWLVYNLNTTCRIRRIYAYFAARGTSVRCTRVKRIYTISTKVVTLCIVNTRPPTPFYNYVIFAVLGWVGLIWVALACSGLSGWVGLVDVGLG